MGLQYDIALGQFQSQLCLRIGVNIAIEIGSGQSQDQGPVGMALPKALQRCETAARVQCHQ